MKVANSINGNIETYNKIPDSFGTCIGGYSEKSSEQHIEDGFWEVEKLPINDTQKYNHIERKGTEKKYHYPIIDKTAEEIDLKLATKIEEYKRKINDYFGHMKHRALVSSMNKSELSIEAASALKEEYENKYHVSNGTLNSNSIGLELITYNTTLSNIQAEINEEFSVPKLDAILTSFGLTPTGTQLEKMFQLIVFKFEHGFSTYSSFQSFNIKFRTKCGTWLDGLLFSKLDSAFLIVDNLPAQLNVSGAELLYNEFNAI